MPPHSPDTGYGYLSPDSERGAAAHPVRTFIEKPDEAAAADLKARGALWSSGIFSAGISRLIEFFPRPAPGMMLDLKSIVEYWGDTSRPSAELGSLYARHPSMDFSRDLLQQLTGRVQMLELPPCGWSDVGTPERLARTLSSLKVPRAGTLVPEKTGGPLNLARALRRFHDFTVPSGVHQPTQP